MHTSGHFSIRGLLVLQAGGSISPSLVVSVGRTHRILGIGPDFNTTLFYKPLPAKYEYSCSCFAESLGACLWEIFGL